jgi:hypothetical protein
MGTIFYATLKSFHLNNLEQAKSLYANFNHLIVKGEVIRVYDDEDKMVCNFAAIMKVFTLSKSKYFTNKFVFENPKLNHVVLTLEEYCRAENVNLFIIFEVYQRELAILKANGVELIQEVQSLSHKKLRSPMAIKNRMTKCARAHLLLPIIGGAEGLEQRRQALVSSLVVVSDVGSKCLQLNTVCSQIAAAVRGAMGNRFRQTGSVPSRTLVEPLIFVEHIFSPYLLVSGFTQVYNLRKGSYLYESRCLDTVQRAFGGALKEFFMYLYTCRNVLAM